ncbi:FkbM family methyltransferase [Solwaraspora sp. WMMB335]|uniref:FkbM family methyltransferase n=1 Tax=Solwaraspora sp. WMMB335 TaxID=3404118 RepID=UPI003B94B653
MGSGASFWTPSQKEARFQYAEIFDHGCYADVELPECAFVVDVGANIGLFSYFITRAFPSCRVLAFEPMPETLEALRRNVDEHRLSGVVIEEYALGEQSEEKAEFTYYPLLPGNSTRYPHEKELQRSVMSQLEPPDDVRRELTGYPVAVAVQRLSSFLPAGRPVDLLKIDVEGAELDVLRGVDADQWPLIGQVTLEVQDLGGRLEAVCELLRGQGFLVSYERSPMIPPEVLTYLVHARRAAIPGV